MNIVIGIISFITACVICAPLFKYFYRAVSSNSKEYEKGFKQTYNKDPRKDFMESRITGGDRYESSKMNADEFGYANTVIFIIPLLATLFIATPLYFLLDFTLSKFGF